MVAIIMFCFTSTIASVQKIERKEQHIGTLKGKAIDFRKDCKPYAAKFCKDVSLGKGKIYRYLKSNAAQL